MLVSHMQAIGDTISNIVTIEEMNLLQGAYSKLTRLELTKSMQPKYTLSLKKLANHLNLNKDYVSERNSPTIEEQQPRLSPTKTQPIVLTQKLSQQKFDESDQKIPKKEIFQLIETSKKLKIPFQFQANKSDDTGNDLSKFLVQAISPRDESKQSKHTSMIMQATLPSAISSSRDNSPLDGGPFQIVFKHTSDDEPRKPKLSTIMPLMVNQFQKKFKTIEESQSDEDQSYNKGTVYFNNERSDKRKVRQNNKKNSPRYDLYHTFSSRQKAVLTSESHERRLLSLQTDRYQEKQDLLNKRWPALSIYKSVDRKKVDLPILRRYVETQQPIAHSYKVFSENSDVLHTMKRLDLKNKIEKRTMMKLAKDETQFAKQFESPRVSQVIERNQIQSVPEQKGLHPILKESSHDNPNRISNVLSRESYPNPIWSSDQQNISSRHKLKSQQLQIQLKRPNFLVTRQGDPIQDLLSRQANRAQFNQTQNIQENNADWQVKVSQTKVNDVFSQEDFYGMEDDQKQISAKYSEFSPERHATLFKEQQNKLQDQIETFQKSQSSRTRKKQSCFSTELFKAEEEVSAEHTVKQFLAAQDTDNEKLSRRTSSEISVSGVLKARQESQFKKQIINEQVQESQMSIIETKYQSAVTFGNVQEQQVLHNSRLSKKGLSKRLPANVLSNVNRTDQLLKAASNFSNNSARRATLFISSGTTTAEK